jgi:GntR family transcriptional regulator, transcriptional repressor for pyruvate dehydrogenase complex
LSSAQIPASGVEKPWGAFDTRRGTLASRIVAEVRGAVFDKRLKAGEFLGTEKDLAARFGVSRMAARDAMRTLEGMGIVEIKMGGGGGARIARGNPRLFAEALSVQLDLAGVTPQEILDAQRSVECMAAELAAENATPSDNAQLKSLLAEAGSNLDDMDAFTRVSHRFHLAIAEASHNRALVFQLISLQHVSWPERNPTLTRDVAERVLDAHAKLAAAIGARDAAACRTLMAEHVGMIRARRLAEHKVAKESGPSCF